MATYFFYTITRPGMHHCYVGKTKDPKNRLAVHKSSCVFKDFPLYQTIRENGGWESWKFDIIDIMDDITNEEALQREQDLINEYQADLNVRNPVHDRRTYNQQYYADHQKELQERYRNKYEKRKTEWKHPRVSSARLKYLALRKVEKTGRLPTDLTCEKHNITPAEIREKLRIYHQN